MVRCVDNYKVFVTSSQNVMNFGPFYPPPMQILLSTLLPGFADGDQQTELNHTLANGGW